MISASELACLQAEFRDNRTRAWPLRMHRACRTDRTPGPKKIDDQPSQRR